jgi:hypothetical protein
MREGKVYPQERSQGDEVLNPERKNPGEPEFPL